MFEFTAGLRAARQYALSLEKHVSEAERKLVELVERHPLLHASISSQREWVQACRKDLASAWFWVTYEEQLVEEEFARLLPNN